MVITGATSPDVTGILTNAGLGSDGKNDYTTGGVPLAELDNGIAITWNDTTWSLYRYVNGVPEGDFWDSADVVATPDLVTTWTGGGETTGTPVVTRIATPGGLGSEYIDATYLYKVASITNGVPVWRKIAHSAL